MMQGAADSFASNRAALQQFDALTDVTSGGGVDGSQQVAHCRGSLPHILPCEPRITAERGM